MKLESNEAGHAIEHKCLRCHAPTQQINVSASGKLMRLERLEKSNEGVTCTVCHQISPARLREPESFTGGFSIDSGGRAFGPHENPFEMPMRHHTDLVPTFSKHVLEAAFCGTCHTVITHPLGTPQGTEFIEQAPYLEWLASAWRDEGRTCQACHLPVLSDADGRRVPMYIAHRPPGGPFPPTSPRTPFGLHLFIGANYQAPGMLASTAPEEAGLFAVTSRRAVQNLQSSLALLATARRDSRGTVEVEATVKNLAGHKLPTAYPSRRLWLHVRAVDELGKIVFESGDWNARSGELTAGPQFQPHYAVIHHPREVQVYEAEFLDAGGNPTLSLTRAASYRKDNRVLPKGFVPERLATLRLVKGAIGPVGVDGDPTFLPGRDTTLYRIPEAAQIYIEACYQSIKPAHAALVGPMPGFDPQPVVIARTEIRVR